MYKAILLTGIPGMGKTTIANTMEEKYAFIHIDLEAAECISEQELLRMITLFVTEQYGTANFVLSWGFPYEYTSLVIYLKNLGVKVVFFDGNRDAALQSFNIRGGVIEEAFFEQVGNLDTFKVKEAIQPIIVNTFSEVGDFLPKEKVIDLVLEL